MNARETAWRIFAGELNISSLEKKGADEMSPSYIVTPLGTMVNRVLIAGVLTEKENIGTDEEPMWKARIQDVSGNYFLNVGRFQPEAAAAMADLDAPCFITVIGKIRSYTSDTGKVYITIRPEKIISIDETTRNLWLLEASQCMWNRLLIMKKALDYPDAEIKDLVAAGISSADAEGILLSLEHYGTPESSRYLKILQDALRFILPNKDIDFGLPDGEEESEEIDLESGQQQKTEDFSSGGGDKEDIVLKFIENLDNNSKGASISEIENLVMSEGISTIELEEIIASLMEKGQIYEPQVGFLRKI